MSNRRANPQKEVQSSFLTFTIGSFDERRVLLTDALSSQEQTVGRTELLDGDQVDQDGRGKAVVGRDTEPVGGGEGEDGGVGGEERDDGGDQATDQHTDGVEDEAGDPLLVTQPTHSHLAHRVEDPDHGEDLGGLAVGDP